MITITNNLLLCILFIIELLKFLYDWLEKDEIVVSDFVNKISFFFVDNYKVEETAEVHERKTLFQNLYEIWRMMHELVRTIQLNVVEYSNSSITKVAVQDQRRNKTIS